MQYLEDLSDLSFLVFTILTLTNREYILIFIPRLIYSTCDNEKKKVFLNSLEDWTFRTLVLETEKDA